MAADKDNSNNYTDNNVNLSNTGDISGFDDEKELEKYGVWVKTGPEEIDDIDEDTDFNLSDLEEEAIITDEEEEMLGELEKELSQDDSDISESLTDLTDTIDDSEIDLNLEDLEEIELDELVSTEEKAKSESEDESLEETFDLDIDFDDDLSPFEEENITEAPLTVEEPGDVNEDLANLELEDLELEDLELDEIEDINFDDDLISEISSPTATVVDDMDLDMDILLDDTEVDIIDDLDVNLLLEEDSEVLLSDSDEKADDIESEIAEISEDDIELADFGEKLDELEEITELELDEEGIKTVELDIETELSSPLAELEEDFDETERIIEDLTDLDDLEEPDFESILESDIETADSSENIETSDVASEILKKIEQELLAIKNELHDVKKELSTLRPESVIEPVNEEQISADDESGFFEEDEDETIALTGDELDNILNTADITEEAGSESESPEEVIQIDDSAEESDTGNLLIDTEDIITIEEDVDLETVQNEEVLFEDLEAEDLSDLETVIIDEEINPDLTEDLLEEEIIERDDTNKDIIVSDESEIISEDIDFESVEETIDDDILVLEDLDTEELIEHEIEIIDEDIELESIEEIPEEEEIVLDDLDTEELTSDLRESVDLSKDIDIEEINETNLEIESLEDESLPVVASEPDATSIIDMELPEMQDEGLTELSPQLKTEIKSVLSYMDQLLESLPEEKIDEFANSEHYEVYKKLFEELGLN